MNTSLVRLGLEIHNKKPYGVSCPLETIQFKYILFKFLAYATFWEQK